MKRRPVTRAACTLLAMLFASGCAETLGSMGYEPPAVQTTRQGERLRAMPAPVERLAVAVYAFNDLTGQRRRSDRYAELSSAVTQGGASIVANALKDMGNGSWFTLVEREGIEHLLRERQIIRSTRDQHSDSTPLPPLLFAGMLIEGGIVAYESNQSQGGFGARLLGIGGSTEFRRDNVTVGLRAVAVQTGEVVLALTISKTVYSAQISASVFRYVAEDKILELDAGAAANEPMQVAVREAIERAVIELAARGAEKGLFRFNSDADRTAVIAAATPGTFTPAGQAQPANGGATSQPRPLIPIQPRT